MRIHTIWPLLALLAVLPTYLSSAHAETAALNGRWQIDAEHSQNLEESGRELNKAMNEQKRAKTQQKFDMSNKSGGNKFQKAANAAEEFIKDDYRSRTWDVSDEVRPLVEAETLKIYVSGKVALLYGAQTRRLLSINPSGRAYSVRGTEFTEDAVGRSLTYIDGDALVIETDMLGGGKLVEHFALDTDAITLVLTIRVQEDSGGVWLEFARRYTRVEGG